MDAISNAVTNVVNKVSVVGGKVVNKAGHVILDLSKPLSQKDLEGVIKNVLSKVGETAENAGSNLAAKSSSN